MDKYDVEDRNCNWLQGALCVLVVLAAQALMTWLEAALPAVPVP